MKLMSQSIKKLKCQSLLLSSIREPNEGLLYEVYRAFLAINFNSHSQEKVTQFLIGSSKDIESASILPPILVVERSHKTFTLCSGFRSYQIAKASGLQQLDAQIYPKNNCITLLTKHALEQIITTVLLNDTDIKKNNKALAAFIKHIKSHASIELKTLINQSPVLKTIFKIPANLLRSYTPKPSVLEQRIELIKKTGDVEID